MLITAERVIVDGVAKSGVGVRLHKNGGIAQVGSLEAMGRPDHTLRGRVLLPGFVNAHSHAFQRLLRGRTQLVQGDDSFWSWRQAMYRVAAALTPESVYTTARQAFIEMLLAGVTTVGEFHYLHHQPGGVAYSEPNELADSVVRAAQDAGVRLCLLRVVYLRGDFDAPLAEHQLRFADASLELACERIDLLQRRLLATGDATLAWGLAPHSLRAVPLDAVVALKARYAHQPLHIHASEQRREVDGSRAAYGNTPVALLAASGVLDANTTVVHATHISSAEVDALALCGATVCVCPTTEADLGDGLLPAGQLAKRGVPLALGTDGQTSSSVLAEARRLEMHERLRTEKRNILAGRDGKVAAKLLKCATLAGASALGLSVGSIARGYWADLVSYDLDDPHLAGADDDSLLATLLFSADSRAVCDVMVGGRWIVQDGYHHLAHVSREAFAKVASRVFG